VLRATGRWEEAESLFRRALAISEGCCAQNDPKLAIRLNNLGDFLRETGRLSEAEPLFLRATETLVNSGRETGDEHPNLRLYVENYGAVLRARGLAEVDIQNRLSSVLEQIKRSDANPSLDH
jgi:tetratricopeptide (TPR) repeat protein